MDPIRFAIENPVKVAVGVILVIMFGLLALSAIPIQLTPDVDSPVISVTTRWEGASPAEIESDVVREQEDKLKAIPGLVKMTSTCQFGEGQIVLEFPVGADINRAMIEVSEKLRQVPAYPDDVDEPEVENSDPNDRDYIAWVILTSEDRSFDVRHLQKWAEDNVKTELERVEGVSEVNVLGGSEPEVQIQIDPVRMAQLSIQPQQLIESIRSLNVNVSAGDVAEGKLNNRVRVTGEYERLGEVSRTIISAPDQPIVRVEDIGKVVQTFKEPFAIVRSKGELALAINAQQEVGSNIMNLMNGPGGFKERVKHVNENVLPLKAQQLGLDGELRLVQVYDQTLYIEQAIALVQGNIFIGGALAIGVLLLFLRSIRTTGIVALSIPVSIVGTFVAMVAMGRNINVISLAGLAFAIGMVVDNAIVVLENIDRQLRLGKSPRQAAFDGGKEVWGAILAATLTTLAVFIPVIFIEEEAGQLFLDISLAICAAVTLSLIASILVIPSAGARFLKPVKEQAADDTTPGKRKQIIGAAGAFTRGVRDLVFWLTGSWFARPLIVVVMAVGSLLASYLLMPQPTYLPKGNRNLSLGILIPPPGYNLDKMQEIGERFERVVRPYWEAKLGEPSEAELPPAMSFDPTTKQMIPMPGVPIKNFFFVGLRSGVMFSGAISADDSRVKPITAVLNTAVQQQPGLIGFADQQALIGGSDGNAVEVEVSGDDYDQVTAAAGPLFFALLEKYGRVTPSPGNFLVPSEEVRIKIDLVRAQEVGLTNQSIGRFAQMLGDGAIVSDYSFEGDQIDLKVLTANQDSGDAELMAQMPMMTPIGEVVTLGSVAAVQRTPAPQEIKRIERRRAVTLSVAVPEDMPVEAAKNQIETELIGKMREDGMIPPTVRTEVAGTAAKLAQVKGAMLGEWSGFGIDSLISLITSRGFLSLLVVFLLMAALFESWLYPVVIMFTVPLATVGGFLGLRVVNEWTDAMTYVDAQQLDVLTMLGFVILVGVVVNNAILIVHQALNFMKGEGDLEGMEGRQKLEPRQAIAESVRTRIRPIFMSTCTSIGGMLPLVLMPGAGSELYRGLGSVVVGGLLVSTVFTLLLTPLVMSLVFDFRRLIGSARV